MKPSEKIRILLIEDDETFGRLVQLQFAKEFEDKSEIVVKKSGEEGLTELEAGSEFDLIIMDHYLPGKTGVETTKALREKGISTPVVFATVHREFDLVVETMKLGVEDFLLKEEIPISLLPKLTLNVLEKIRLRQHISDLEISGQRLEAIQKMVEDISEDLLNPLSEMKTHLDQLLRSPQAESYQMYLKIIGDNLIRMENKIEKLKSLKDDRTVQYIKNIRMLDIS